MPKKSSSVPGYCLHKPTGQAYVRIGGRMHYLGAHGSPESKAAYSRLILEAASSPATVAPSAAPCDQITVVEILAAYQDFAEGYYLKNGKPTRTLGNIADAVRPLRDLYATLPAVEFGPKKLKAVREAMIQAGLCRKGINGRVGIIKRIFAWAVAEELIPASVHHGLQALRGLGIGRSEAPESKPVPPVPDEVVEGTLPFLPAVPAAMVRLQRLCGARPTEICILRPCDVDRSEAVWTYRPASHKTQHHGRERVIYLGPKAQELLTPYLLRPAEFYCFDPDESERKRRAEVHSRRKTPLSCGNRPGSKKTAKRKRPLRDHYDVNSYRKAIWRAVEKANEAARAEAAKREEAGGDGSYTPIPRWSPNRLRHAVATEVRKTYGLEGAQVVLGHARADVTQVYAERDSRLAAEVMAKIG